MTKGTIIYMGNYELPDKNAAAHRVMNNGKIFTALGYQAAYLGIVRERASAVSDSQNMTRISMKKPIRLA